MKTFVLLMTGVILSLAFINYNEHPKPLSIQEIMKNPNFEVTLTSSGGHSGKSVLLEVKSKTNKDVRITVPAGTLFYPSDENEQTLVSPREQYAVINKMKTNSIPLNGFCTEAHDKSPTSAGTFALGNNKNEKLDKLLQFFKEHKGISINGVQEAIWCITDDYSISRIYTDNEVLNKQLKKVLSEITGDEIPWFTNKQEITIDNNGYLVSESVEVTGEVKFSTTKKTTIKSKVLNEAGENVFPNQNDLVIPRALNNITLNFKVSVEGWEKGKYFVIYYTTEGKTILKKEFTV